MLASASGYNPLPAASAERDDEPAVTHHQITIAGKVLKYTARAGFLSLRDEFNKIHARIFYVSYTLDNPVADRPRPLAFVWNGGPGAPASLLHLGALGPMRVKDLEEYTSPPPPYELTVNESTWLEVTDLVFVDPVGTGYSYATSPEYAKEFWNPKGDIDSIAEFIRLYLVHYGLYPQPPTFLVGESYGTFRAAGVAATLTSKGTQVAGVVLISPVLTFRSRGEEQDDLSYVLRLPSYTAAAFVHRKLPSELLSDFDNTLRQAERWAEEVYSVALLKGSRLSPAEREQVLKGYVRFTGLDTAYVDRQELRVGMDEFASQLLREQGKVLGHYDTRVTADTTKSGGQYDPRMDPSLNTRGTSVLIVPYLRKELGFESDAFYAGPFGGRWPPPESPRGDWMSTRWDWRTGEADRSAALAEALHKNRSMRVMMVSGYFDLATPYFDAVYTVAHMGLPPELRNNVELVRYRGGHMVYLDPQLRREFQRDFAAFIEKALAPVPGK